MNARLSSIAPCALYRASARTGLAWMLCLLLAAFVLVRPAVLQAQDDPTQNPTGPSGDYNGEVTTAGSYDPLTQNAKRAVTDLVVPGSEGTYPLAFTRIYNSAMYLVSNEPRVLGDGGNWRHSYMWTITQILNSGRAITGYTIAYPDGSAATFRNSANRTNTPSGEYSTYWHGVPGVQDRLEVPGGSAMLCLHRSDGGLVYFDTSLLRAVRIVDPYGAATMLGYDGANRLTTITEPGGRSLTLNYITPMPQEVVYDDGEGHTQTMQWLLLDNVTASTGQKVTYSYTDTGVANKQSGGSNSYPYTQPYKVLSTVTYQAEPNNSSAGYVQAGYTYEYYSGGRPVITTAYDPHYAGAMVGIRYLYTYTGSGLIQAEENGNNANVKVSSLSRGYNGGVLTATETRGDQASGGASITRAFSYGETSVNGGASNAAASQLTTRTDYQGNRTTLAYYGAGDSNGQGNLFSVTDALGHATLYGHEPYAGQVNITQLPDGRKRTWFWLAKDLSTQLQPYYLYQYTDERGQQTTYKRYPNTGLLNEVDYPDGSKETYVYSGWTVNGNTFYKVYSHTDKRGAQTINGYDETDANHGGSGHVALLTSVTRSYTNSAGASTSERTALYYDGLDRLVQSVDPRGVTTQFAYNGRHQLTRTTHASDGTHVDRTYDDLGNCTAVGDEMGHITHTAYDEYRRPTSVTVPVNADSIAARTTNTTYDGRDNSNNVIAPATSHTDARWSYQVLPSGRGVQRIYSPNGWLTDEYSGQTNNNLSSLDFTTCLHDKASLQYDACGFLLASTDAQGQTWQSAPDQYGRPSTTTDPLGHTTTTSYYAANSSYAGLVQSVAAPGNNAGSTLTTQYTAYDANGHLTGWTDPANNSFSSGYNPAGDLLSQTDGMPTSQHPATAYSYDGLGRKTRITYPDSGYQAWTYDASGNLASYRNRAGNTQTYNSYDARNRPTGYSWDDGVTSTAGIAFDPANRCTFYSNGFSRLDMTYDDSGALLTEKQSIGGGTDGPTVTYTPDTDGNVAAVAYPHGDTAHFYLDFLGRLQTLGFAYGSNPQGVYSMASYGYDGTWLADRQTNYNVLTQYGYQANGRVVYVDQQNTSPSRTFNHQTYGYNPDGQLSWTRGDGNGTGDAFNNGIGNTFLYDKAGQLTTQDYDAQNVNANTNYGGDVPANDPPTNTRRSDAFSYDAAGNRTYDNEGGLVSSPSFDAEDRHLGMGYDTHGNVTSMPYSPTNGAGMQYAYNGLNQLTSASGNGHSASFVYDPKGRLCQRTVDGVTRRLFYAGDQIIEEDDASNNKVCFYLYGAMGREFRIDNTVTLYHYDGRGWLSHVTEIGGNVVEQYHYDAWGLPRVYSANGQTFLGNTSTVAGGNRYLWAQGYEWYPEVGLYRCGARFYAPTWGHWMQPDPIGQKGGLNIYAYCHNDPVKGVDPSGLEDDLDNGPKQNYGNGYDPSDPRDAGGIIATGDTPTGSHIPSVTYGIENGGIYSLNAIDGITTLANGRSYVTGSGAIESYSAALTFPSRPANSQNYPSNPISIEAIDIASVSEGIIGNAISIALGAVTVVAGALDFDPTAIQQGFDTFKSGLLPRYGLFAGPGWGIPETYFGQAPMNTPIDVGAYGHDGNYYNGRPLQYTDPQAWRDARNAADRQLISDVYSGPVGIFGAIYRLGIEAIYGGH